MTVPTARNISHRKGSTYSEDFKVLSSGANYDLTNWTITSEVKSLPVDTGTLIATMTVTKTDVTAGEFNMSLTATQTAALTAGVYYYDIIMTHTGGTVTPLWAGTFTIQDRITD